MTSEASEALNKEPGVYVVRGALTAEEQTVVSASCLWYLWLPLTLDVKEWLRSLRPAVDPR